MALEFQESDVIFSDHHHDQLKTSNYYFLSHPQLKSAVNGERLRRRKMRKPTMGSSSPIRISTKDLQCGNDQSNEVVDFEDEGWEGEVVPPHLIVARRVAGKMEFSVCSGKGRTLKGRDLKEVRNEILRMTGFLET